MIWKSRPSKFPFRNPYKMTWKQAWTKKTTLKVLELQKLIYTGPKITPRSNKILKSTISNPSCCSYGPPAWSRGAKIAPRCSRSPNGSPECRNGGTESASRSQKGPEAESVAIKIYYTIIGSSKMETHKPCLSQIVIIWGLGEGFILLSF